MAYKGKLPPDDFSAKKKEMKYGTTHGFQRICGTAEFHYENPAESDKTGYIKCHATGSYETMHADDALNAMYTLFDIGERRSYTVGGSSSQTDGHHDSNVESTKRENTMGDHGRACKTHYHVSTAGSVKVHNEYKKEIIASRSESKMFTGSYGDSAHEHSGNWHEAFEKDQVEAVGKNKITMVQGGDYAIHVQEGNYDNHIAQKARIYADNDILIESKTKITLKVGSSKIVIDGSSIEIIANGKSGRIDLN